MCAHRQLGRRAAHGRVEQSLIVHCAARGVQEPQGGEAASLWQAVQEAASQRAVAESALMQVGGGPQGLRGGCCSRRGVGAVREGTRCHTGDEGEEVPHR